MTYQPTTRILTLLELLQARSSVSGRELADRLEVDARSIRRYVVSLQDLGIPVESTRGPGGGYRLRPGNRMAPLLFTGPEAIATALGLLEARRAGPRIDPAAVEGALAKLERVLPEGLRRTVEAIERSTHLESSPTGSRPDADVVATLASAAHDRRRVSLAYRAADGSVTARDIDPYGIAGTLGHWYVVGWCHLRAGIRSFRIDRIIGLEPTEGTFVPPPGFDALEHLVRGMATMPSRFVLDVRFAVPSAVVAQRVPPAYATLEPDGDGTIARYPADDIDLMASYLAGLGIPFTVRGPAALRTALARVADRLAAAVA